MDEAPNDYCTLLVISDMESRFCERRFPKNLTIEQLKQRVSMISGADVCQMELSLLDNKKNLLVKLCDDKVLLSSYYVDKAVYLLANDPQVRSGEYEDFSKVKKYELSSDEYKNRADTFLAFKNKLIHEGKLEENKDIKNEEVLKERYPVGSRCEVEITGMPNRKGTVQFAGKADFKAGYWIGVEYDGPVGKNDGSVQGKRYFECKPNYGGFVRPCDVIIGNFPKEEEVIDETV